MIPHELWQKIFTFLDLKSQHNVSKVSGDFCELIVSIWTSNIARLKPQFDVISEDHDIVRLNLTMRSLLQDNKYNPLEEQTDAEYKVLYKLLQQHKILKQIHHLEEIQDCHENFKKVRLPFNTLIHIITLLQYLFFHDYNVFHCKYLDLHQKWPRPGQKSLEKFIKQNQVSIVLVFLPTDTSFQHMCRLSRYQLDLHMNIADSQMGVFGIECSSSMKMSIGGLLVIWIFICFEQRTDQLSPLC